MAGPKVSQQNAAQSATLPLLACLLPTGVLCDPPGKQCKHTPGHPCDAKDKHEDIFLEGYMYMR